VPGAVYCDNCFLLDEPRSRVGPEFCLSGKSRRGMDWKSLCGRVSKKTVPVFTEVELTMRMIPRCFSAMLFVSQRPEPVPVSCFVAKNGSQILLQFVRSYQHG